MAIEVKKNIVKLSGNIQAEEAEQLFLLLMKRKRLKIDISECTHVHTAVLQLLLVFNPEILGKEDSPFNLWLQNVSVEGNKDAKKNSHSG